MEMKSLFFPAWPLPADPVLGFGLVLCLAIALGELAHRFQLPRISAYVATGVILSFFRAAPQLAPLLPLARMVFELAFALILFELGQRLDLGWLRRNPWLLACSLAESLLAFLAVGALMLWLKQPVILAVMIAAIASSTGPAVVLGICRDSEARGQLTDRLQLLSALSISYSFVVLGIAYAWQHGQSAAPLTLMLLHPLYLIVGSILLGSLTAGTVLRLLTHIRPGNFSQTLATIGLIIASVALAKMLNLSVVLSALTAGTLSRSLDRKRQLQAMDYGLLSRLALIVVFVATGTLLDVQQFAAAFWPALGLLVARASAKTLGIMAFARSSGLPMRKASLLSVSLLPMSGAALLWVERTASLWPEIGAQLAAVVLTALVIMECLAPPLLQWALRRANETGDAA